MNKIKINSIIDILSAIAFLIITLSGLVLWFILPSGSGFRGGRSLTEVDGFLEINHHGWTQIHNISGIILLVLIIIHLILHWQWIKKIPNYFKN